MLFAEYFDIHIISLSTVCKSVHKATSTFITLQVEIHYKGRKEID